MEKQIEQVVAGSLLGDGWLESQSDSGTAMYRVKYSNSYDYIKWIRELIKDLNPSEIKSIKSHNQHYIYTEARKDIGELYQKFYPKKIKIIPSDIGRLLTPLALAIWYQDDGTLDNRPRNHLNAMFATHCFTYEECKLLTEVLWENFQINASVCKSRMRGKVYYRLYIWSESMDRFIEVVRPFIHKTFEYKIP